jgi:hypothetical protein
LTMVASKISVKFFTDFLNSALNFISRNTH